MVVLPSASEAIGDWLESSLEKNPLKRKNLLTKRSFHAVDAGCGAIVYLVLILLVMSVFDVAASRRAKMHRSGFPNSIQQPKPKK